MRLSWTVYEIQQFIGQNCNCLIPQLYLISPLKVSAVGILKRGLVLRKLETRNFDNMFSRYDRIVRQTDIKSFYSI